METNKAKEYWKERFDEYPQTDSEKHQSKSKQITDNSKVNINLLKENEVLKERIAELESLLPKIKSIKLCLMAHPDNEEGSEFEDRISDLTEIENTLSQKKCKCKSPTIRYDGHEYCALCGENIKDYNE